MRALRADGASFANVKKCATRFRLEPSVRCLTETLTSTGDARCSSAVFEEVAFAVGGGERRCTFVRGRGVTGAAEPPEQIGSCGVERVVVVEVELDDESERRGGAEYLADRDCAVERDD